MLFVTHAFPPEFRLIAACCIWPPSERADNAIRLAASQSMDWSEFLRLVGRHRVAGLVHAALARSAIVIPAEVEAQIAAAATDTARQALALAAEALRLQAALDATGVPSLYLKGSTLAVMAYGSIAIKQAWDIDVLVPVALVGEAVRVLRDMGYERVSPPASLSDERFSAWTQFAHEAIFRHVRRGAAVELHWRLTDNAPLEAGDFRGDGLQSVEVGGRRLQTLGDDALFSYLCAHGAHHAWGRLKWLADVAAWLGQMTPERIAELYRAAQRVGAGRAAEQALLLCERVLGFELPDVLSGTMGKDRTSRWLVAVALETLAGPVSGLEGSLKIEASQFLLARTLGEGWDHFAKRLIGWRDFQSMALPRQLYFLYPVVRLPSWFWRRIWQPRIS